MKRVWILLALFVFFAWIGPKLTYRQQPSTVPAHKLAASGHALADPDALPKAAQTPAEKKVQQEKWFGAETIVAAKRAVRASLTDPESAKFDHVRANYTEAFGVVACGRVNSRNGFGGYTGYKRFVSSGQSAILEGRDNILKAWEGACLQPVPM